MLRNPHDWVMVRSHRPFDKTSNRYRSVQELEQGDAAMRAWFEYFAAKGWRKRLDRLYAILKVGNSLQFPHRNPEMFDLSYVCERPVLPERFWDELRAARAARISLTDEQIAKRRAMADKIAADFAKTHRAVSHFHSRGDSRTPAEAIPWEERARRYQENPSRLSVDALKTHAVTRSWPEESEL